MATSAISHAGHVMRHVILNSPSSVLDVGIGFGRWGFLCREMLDAFSGRVDKSLWKIRIDGIEIYEKYIQDHQRHIYDAIHIGDAKEVIKTLGRYGVIIIGDMLEHLEKEDAWGLFHDAMERADIGLILNLPLGEIWLRELGMDNKNEDHLSWWTLGEFAQWRPDTSISRLGAGMEHASMFISAANYKYTRLLDEGERAEACGRPERAAPLYSAAVNLSPERPEGRMALANALIGMGRVDLAEKALEEMVGAVPDYTEGRETLMSLRAAIGKETAREVLQK